jgi:type VI secretion system secreted protein VgrG
VRAFARLDHKDLPADVVVLGLRAREGLSVLFDVSVDFVTETADLDLKAMLWSTACATIARAAPPASERSFHGVIEEARYLGFDDTWHRYRLRLRPTLHGLAYRVRTRIFQDLDVVEIVTKVLQDAGADKDARFGVETTYPKREHCCQWKESELAFVLRLLEEEGIFYWFEHTETEHTLIFADHPSAHTPIAGDTILPLRSREARDEESIWNAVLAIRNGHDSVKSRDWYFEQPEEPYTNGAGGDGARTRYEYPGRYKMGAEGARRAHVRHEEALHDARELGAEHDSLRVAPGKKLELADVSPDALAGEYLVLGVEHTFAVSDRYDGGVSVHGDYRGTLRAIPSSVPFRAPRVTPKPIASGLESAVVTGPAGEEIHVDPYGRIKVHFYWDREGKVDDTASCWVRFQQMNTSGAMILPRLGWEVHVAFIDGDPDRPVALHKAYNAETLPPYALPANKTQSALQSSTSPGGGSTNEIRLQDGNGGMEWFLHASKDLDVVVAHDEKETIGVDATEVVSATFTATVGGNETGTVKGNQSVTVKVSSAAQTVGNKTVHVGGNDDWGIKKNFTWNTGSDRTETIDGLMNVLANKVDEVFNVDHDRTVGKVQALVSVTSIAETVGGSKTEKVKAAKAIVTPKEYAESMKGSKTLKSGAVKLKTGGDMTLMAKGAIALTSAGGITIKCDENAMITGRQVRVTAGKATLSGGGGKFKMSSSLTIDAKKFGGAGGPKLHIKGKIDYK